MSGSKQKGVSRVEAIRAMNRSGVGDGISRVGKTMNVSIDKLIEGELNERQTFDEDGLRELAETIIEHGLIHPIRVFEEGQGSEKKYVIHGGHRRYRAIKQYTDIDKVSVLIAKRGDDTKVVIESIVDNNYQIPPNPMETAVALQAILDDESNGIPNQVQLAKTLGKSRDWVTGILSLLKLPDTLKKKVKESELKQNSARVLRDISRLKDDAEKEEYIDELVSGASGRSVSEKIKEKRKRTSDSPKPNPKVVAFKDESVSVILQSRTGKSLTKGEQKSALEKALKKLQ